MIEANKTQKVIDEYSQRELGEIKVLMIEDDTFLAELVLEKLSQSGCIPYTTTDGNEALSLAELCKPNIIILDLMLPGTSGEQILTNLKAHDELSTIPVIVFTNKSDESDMKHLIELGAAEFLVKSATDLSVLTELVKSRAL